MARSEQANFEDLAESIPHIVWMAQPDGATDYFNRHGTDYTGMPAETNYGWGWVELVHQADANRARRGWEEATRTQTPFQLEYRIRRNDGIYRWHALRALPVQGPDGSVQRWLGTATDIDEAVRQADLLAQVERQTDEVLALLATLQDPNETFGFVERAVRAIRLNAALARGGNPPAQPAADLSVLSPAEMRVVRLVALGYTNKEAANQLAISLRTVEAHRARAQQKLGVHTRAELVRLALAAGLADER